MKYLNLTNCLFALLLLAITGFKPLDSADVKIQIITPAENASVKMGDTVFITGSVTSDNALHDVSIKVKTADNLLTLYSENIHTHGNQLTINKNYIQTIKYKTELVLEISTRDHSGTVTATATRKFFSDKK